MKMGILGGGQLGLMLADAAHALSIDVLVLDPKPDAVAGRVARHLAADWEDASALSEMMGCDIVTYEFENVPTGALDALQEQVIVHPSTASLEVSGDRVLEKEFLRGLGIETAPFAPVESRADLDHAVATLGLPAILKTRRFGYDGKGQVLLRDAVDLDQAWSTLGGQPLVLEGFVPFDREVSVLAARGRDGSTVYWPATENVHIDGILHISRSPARDVSEALLADAIESLEALMERLEYVGVLVVEFFQVGDRLIANEIACRVHNSGHWTIEGASASQFENHVRAVAGLPLAPTDAPGLSAMVNLVGEIPPIDSLAEDEGIFVHDYGKSPAPGRKLGHVTVCAPTAEVLDRRIARVLDVVGDRGQA